MSKKGISVFNEMFQNDCDLIYTQKRFEDHQIRSLKNRTWSPHVILKIQSKHLCWSGIAETSPWNADTWPQRIDRFGLVQLGQATSKKTILMYTSKEMQKPPGKYMAQLQCIRLSWRRKHITTELGSCAGAIYSGSRFIFVDHGPKTTKDKTLSNRTASLQENGQEAFTHLFLEMKSRYSSFRRYLTSQTRKEKRSYLQMRCIMYKLCIIMTIVPGPSKGHP